MKKRSTVPNIKRRNEIRGPIDSTLLLLVGLFLLIGLIVIYDATVVISQNLYGTAYKFVSLQLAWITIGLIGFYIFSFLEMKKIRQLTIPLFFLSFGLLLFLGIMGILPCSLNFVFAPCINGANRWFYLNPSPLPSFPLLGVLGFQPTSFAKFTLVIFLAAKLEKSLRTNTNAFLDLILVTGSVALLVLLQPNLSNAVIIFTIGIVMYFSSGADLKQLFFSIPPLVLLGFLFIVSSDYRRQRLLTFMSLESGGELSTGYHIKQILIALGSGGIFGVGFGQSRQKFQYLPEVFADSIFAIIGEELGFVGTTFLILLFVALIYKGYRIALRTEDMFSRLIAVGVTTWIALQFFVNVGAMTKIIPLTGIPLPLISYGGSSLVFILMGLGLLANVSRDIK